jgi:phage regulator Rha-like protein
MVTSRDIKDWTGKEHKSVLRDIDNEIEQLGDEIGRTIFVPTTYTDECNRTQRQYTMGKEGAMQLLTRYDAKVRYACIKKIEELEQIINTPQVKKQIPQTYPEALRELANEVEAKLLETKRADEAEQEVTFLKAQPKQLDETTPIEIAKELCILSLSDRPHFQLVGSILTKSSVGHREFWNDLVKQYQKVYPKHEAIEVVRQYINGLSVNVIHTSNGLDVNYRFKLM